ncbi:MAG: ANTAR domain-containing protein [Acidimicrobiales bacterium]
MASARAEVHQAAGMVAAQLEIGVDEALHRLQAVSWSEDRPLSQTARDVIEGRRRF